MSKYVISVDGMSCGNNDTDVIDTIKDVADIVSANSDQNKGELILVAEDLDILNVVSAICTLGYCVKRISRSYIANCFCLIQESLI